MAKVDVAQTGFATVNGKERPVRLLADGTTQWNNRNNPAKGKWADATETDEVVWTSSDGGVFEVELPPVADDPEYLETEIEQLEADGLTEDDGDATTGHDTGDDAPQTSNDEHDTGGQSTDDGDDTNESIYDDTSVTDKDKWAFLVSARGARGIALLFAGETPDSKSPYLGFATETDVDAFLATNLRSAWSTSVKDPSVFKRRGVHLLLVHANDGARTVVREYDPRPVTEDAASEA